jgi:hypothetical protein
MERFECFFGFGEPGEDLGGEIVLFGVVFVEVLV